MILPNQQPANAKGPACYIEHSGKTYGSVRVVKRLFPDEPLTPQSLYEVERTCCGSVIELTQKTLTSYRGQHPWPKTCRFCKGQAQQSKPKPNKERPAGIRIEGSGWWPFLYGPMGRFNANF